MELIRTAGLDLVMPVETIGGVAGLALGDCLEVLRMLPDNCVDSIVTDPPYGLSFMGKRWDYGVPGTDVWAECLRVLKPGGHLLAFAGTRTQHRMAVRIEDAGFEIRDMIAWVYGSGFPKSLDVSKAIDKARHSGRDEVLRVTGWIRERCREIGLNGSHLNAAAGVVGMASHWMTDKQQPLVPTLEQWRKIEPVLGAPPEWMVPLLLPAFELGEAWRNAEVVGKHSVNAPGNSMRRGLGGGERDPLGEIKAPATDAARQWQGRGTALKPALEPITVARKPLIGTVAANVLAHGTGAINVDGCRVETTENLNGGAYAKEGGRAESQSLHAGSGMNQAGKTTGKEFEQPTGRWPANLIHDGSEDVLAAFPQTPGQQGDLKETGRARPSSGRFGDMAAPHAHVARKDVGSAARFFYCAKASKADRNAGCEALPLQSKAHIASKDGGGGGWSKDAEKNPNLPRTNVHPTVKPTDLMRYLCRLVTPPGGVVLDPFMGSGSTGKAAMLEGFRFVGCELSPEYMAIASARILHAVAGDLAG